VKRTQLFLFLAATVSCRFLSHDAPSGQPPLAAMDLGALRAAFNRASDLPRLIVLLSPT
jgi:hypothetical protein